MFAPELRWQPRGQWRISQGLQGQLSALKCQGTGELRRLVSERFRWTQLTGTPSKLSVDPCVTAAIQGSTMHLTGVATGNVWVGQDQDHQFLADYYGGGGQFRTSAQLATLRRHL